MQRSHFGPWQVLGICLSSSFDVGGNGGIFAAVNVFSAQSQCPGIGRLCRARWEACWGLIGLLFAPGSAGCSWSVCGCCSRAQGSAPDSALLPRALQGELPELLILSLENVEVIIHSLPHTSLTGVWVNEHLLTCGNKCCASAGAVAALTQRAGTLQLFPVGLCCKTKSPF